MTNKFILVDGYNLIYRSCLANGPFLTSPSGEPTKGTYFFTKAILKLCNMAPSHFLFCLDGPRKLLNRRKIDETYKAKRTDPPEDLVVQANRCKEVIQKLKLPTLSVVGYEADDIIATITHRHANEVDCLIVSGDKDLHQLVNDRVKILDLGKDELIDTDKVIDRWGVAPNLIPEIQILTGDSTDNVKGVEGIGPVKALALIKQFGTADNAKSNLDKLTPKMAASMTKADLVKLRALVTLDTKTPIEHNLDYFRFGPLKMDDEAKELFNTLGFKRWST